MNNYVIERRVPMKMYDSVFDSHSKDWRTTWTTSDDGSCFRGPIQY